MFVFFCLNVFCRDSAALTQLILLYVNRSYHVWKENDLLSWLERNVHKVLDRVDGGDPVIQDYEAKRSKRYQGQMPLSIARHIILSDIKGVSPLTNVNENFANYGAPFYFLIVKRKFNI